MDCGRVTRVNPSPTILQFNASGLFRRVDWARQRSVTALGKVQAPAELRCPVRRRGGHGWRDRWPERGAEPQTVGPNQHLVELVVVPRPLTSVPENS